MVDWKAERVQTLKTEKPIILGEISSRIEALGPLSFNTICNRCKKMSNCKGHWENLLCFYCWRWGSGKGTLKYQRKQEPTP